MPVGDCIYLILLPIIQQLPPYSADVVPDQLVCRISMFPGQGIQYHPMILESYLVSAPVLAVYPP